MEVPQKVMEMILDIGSEARANEASAQRRAKYWLTGLAIKNRATKLRGYIGRISDEDIKFLRRDPNSVEAVEDLIKLSVELRQFAVALKPDPEEVRLLVQARERINGQAAA